jgi:hypothetical protein
MDINTLLYLFTSRHPLLDAIVTLIGLSLNISFTLTISLMRFHFSSTDATLGKTKKKERYKSHVSGGQFRKITNKKYQLKRGTCELLKSFYQD